MNSYRDMFDLDNVEIKVIRIFLLSFLILLGYQTLQFINTRRIDKKHHELLVVRNQVVEELQNLLIQNSTIQRKLLNMALTQDQAVQKELQQIIDSAEASSTKSMNILQEASLKLDSPVKLYLSDLKISGNEYRMTYLSYISLVRSGDLAKALEVKDQSLRPAYESYQEMQQRIIVYITSDLIQQSNALSSYTTISSWILFFAGLIPFIYAISKLIYLSIIIKLKSVQTHSIQKTTPDKP